MKCEIFVPGVRVSGEIEVKNMEPENDRFQLSHVFAIFICSLRRFSGFLLVFRVYLELQHATKVCTVLVVLICFLSEFWLVLFTSSFF